MKQLIFTEPNSAPTDRLVVPIQSEKDIEEALKTYEYKYCLADLVEGEEELISLMFNFDYGKWEISSVNYEVLFFPK